MKLDYNEKKALKYQLIRRMESVEEFTCCLASAGTSYRQLLAIDAKLKRDFPHIELPDFRSGLDAEISHQLKTGDPLPGSFNDAIQAEPRHGLEWQVKDDCKRAMAEAGI